MTFTMTFTSTSIILLTLLIVSTHLHVHSFVPTLPLRRSPSHPPISTSTSLSGIRGFRSWFNTTFPTAYSPIDTTVDFEEFDHVLLDMNQILHVVLRRRQDEDKALLAMFKELDDTLKFAKPRRCVVFSFDGPPSAAKLATQRVRRQR